MTTMNSTVGAPSARTIQWSSINWKAVQDLVYKLQVRIAKAIKSRHYSNAKALQWILTHSFYAKLLAIKRVTQNKGKNTPGVDHVILKTP
jgi:RNA-directed DNA polymerase